MMNFAECIFLSILILALVFCTIKCIESEASVIVKSIQEVD